MGHSRFTKSDLPWILVWQKEFEALPEAKQFEAKINPILPNDLCNGFKWGNYTKLFLDFLYNSNTGVVLTPFFK